MLPKSLIKGFNKARLKGLMAVFFLALAVPTAVLIWQAYGQLKWEAFHQYRGVAEGLSKRIDSVLMSRLEMAEARTFADYTFLVVAGDQELNFVQRSPLSEFPVAQDLPGVIGYFQVGTEGEFSTPLLPQGNADPATFGISADEYRERTDVAQKIRQVLSDNRLVPRQPTGLRRGLASLPAAPEDVLEEVAVEQETDALGRVTREVQQIDDLRFVVESSYDKTGRLAKTSYSTGWERTFTYGGSEIPISQRAHSPDDGAGTDFTFEYDEESVYTRSDHYQFARKGIPIAFFFSGFHPDYHRKSDTVEKINFEKLTNTAKLVYLTAFMVADDPERLKKDPK